MTPEQNNVVRAQGRKCVAEIQQALECRPNPKWNAVVPPIIKKDQRRKAKLYMKKQPKVDPEDDEFETDEERKQARNEQFERIHLAYLLSVVTKQVTDNATGEENYSLSFEDALEHIDWLPEGQLARLDAKVADLLFTDAISRQIELQEDFS